MMQFYCNRFLSNLMFVYILALWSINRLVAMTNSSSTDDAHIQIIVRARPPVSIVEKR